MCSHSDEQDLLCKTFDNKTEDGGESTLYSKRTVNGSSLEEIEPTKNKEVPAMNLPEGEQENGETNENEETIQSVTTGYSPVHDASFSSVDFAWINASTDEEGASESDIFD